MSQPAILTETLPDTTMPAQTPQVLVCAPAAGRDLTRLIDSLSQAAGPGAFTIAIPTGDHNAGQAEPQNGTRVVTFFAQQDEASLLPWFTHPQALRGIAEVAAREDLNACLLLGQDYCELSATDFTPLLEALLTKQCAAVTPLYDVRPTDGLLNTAVIYPLLRALYGTRVRFPLAPTIGVTLELLERASRGAGSHGNRPVFLATEAAAANLAICQARVHTAVPQIASGREPAQILESILGPLFSDMESKAPLWQRVRASQEPVTLGTHLAPRASDDPPPDMHRMIEQFALASRNLAEVWGLIMPPSTQVALKRLSHSDAAAFRMPDDLWARVVFDFALAYRTRNIGRGHLFGAFAPLYLAWIASFLNAPATSAATRAEQTAAAFEAEKPYLLQRWRWPDRFNP